MSRNRSGGNNDAMKRLFQQSAISSISAQIPLSMANENDENDFQTQSLSYLKTLPDVHSLVQSCSENSNQDSKRVRTVCQPKGTIPYTVGNSDTLEKVALRFNATPSELLQLNKLSARIVFPGQILFVPDENSSKTSDPKQLTSDISSDTFSATSSSSSIKPKDGNAFILLTDPRQSTDSSPFVPPQQDVGPMVWSMARQTKATRPGHAQRLESDLSTESEPSLTTDEDHLPAAKEENRKQSKVLQKSSSVDVHHHGEDEWAQRFIKINVRLMTEDRQSVAGTLLVTPNAVMFDPDVRDVLVKEHGVEHYGLIIRMDYLVGLALYEDLVMYEHEASSRDEEKRKMFHSTSVKHVLQTSPSLTSNTDEAQIHELMSSLLDRIEKELNLSVSSESCCMLFNAASTVQRQRSRNSVDQNYNNNDDHSSVLIDPNDNYFDESLEFSNDSFQPLDEYKHSIGILLDDNENKHVNQHFHRVPSQISYVFDWTRFRRAVRIKKGCHLENCVPLEQFNKRFGEIDKLLHKHQQTYCEPLSIEIPFYLCVKTRIHANDIPSLHAKKHRKSHGKVVSDVHGKRLREHEYWFSVPKDKIDSIHSFFLRWTPEQPHDPLINHPTTPPLQSKSTDVSSNKGFVLLANDDPDLSGDSLSSTKSDKTGKQVKKPHYLKRQSTLLKDWEIISVDEIYRRIHPTASDETDDSDDHSIPPPQLLQPSTLINEEQSKQILLELPARIHGMNWYMIFSTETHGFSLSQLYRRTFEIDHDFASLLIVKDTEQNIFGAFVPHQLIISESLYGTGESFLFTFYPDFQVFNWSGYNEFYVKGDINSLGFGIGEGTYGLWLDNDLYHGRTCRSKTFNSEQLTSNEDFIIASIEVWTFIN